MWLPIREAVQLGLKPNHYSHVSKILRVVISSEEDSEEDMYLLIDLKTGHPVFYFDTCEEEQQALLEVCYNLAEVDQNMNIGTITVATLLEILEAHANNSA